MGEANEIGLRFVPETLPAKSTLTFSGQPTDGDTIVINGRTYTFKTTVAAADDILIGASAAATRDNTVYAINDYGGVEGTDYGSGTVVNPDVAAGEINGGDNLEVVAYTPGTGGDSITTTSAGTSPPAWDGATLSGGRDAGTPVDSTEWLTLSYTSEALSPSIQYDRSERITGDVGPNSRMMRKRAVAGKDPSGSVSIELAYGDPLHELLAAALGGNWAGDRLTGGPAINLFTIEKIYNELTNKFEIWTGAVVSSIEFTIPWGSKATATVNFMSRTHDDTQTSSQVGSGSVAAEPTTEILAGARDFGNLLIDGSSITGLIVSEMTLAISANARGRNGLGNLGPVDHKFGDLSITGTMNFYLADVSFTEFQAAIANTDKRLQFDLTDPASNVMSFDFPKINWSAEPASSQGRNTDVFHRLPFELHSDVPVVTRA